MSNVHNEAILERLYDEAYEELRPLFDQKEYGDMAYRDEDLHLAAVDLAKKRLETDNDQKRILGVARDLPRKRRW